MTPTKRYQALDRILRAHRGRPFSFNINGAEPLLLEADCVTFEGANTSFQVHLKVRPERFVAMMNASFLALAPALAVCGNSPVFLQHRLWEETRIAVFKQTVDERDRVASAAHQAPRVGIGRDWWRGTAAEAITQHLHAHAVLLPLVGDENPRAALAACRTPALSELRTHNGTIWHWNRPVYDPAAGGHLRIEFRALPAGPTILDMTANAALMLGLTLALESERPALDSLPFAAVESNLYRAAQHGLSASLQWPVDGRVVSIAASDLLMELLPRAEQALVQAGVNAEEARGCLDVIRGRLGNGRTGAQWQHDFLTAADAGWSRDESLLRLVRRYRELSGSGVPVHEWPMS